MVKAHFADLEVEDRLKVAEGGPPREQWLGAVSFGLKQLSHLKQGSARLLNEGLKVDGEARSANDYAEVKKALSGPVPTGLTILNDHVRPPLPTHSSSPPRLGRTRSCLREACRARNAARI